ncbi:TonB-dependent receptor plug domain-containing protein [Thiovibrio sp. JS02]
MKKGICSLILLSLCLSTSGFAQETAILDEVVVTATRSEEKVATIPAKVEVIDGQDLELTTGDTLSEKLKKNSSVGVVEYPGALAGIGIRGFRPEALGITRHSLILINGRPAGATNLAAIPMDNVERIEVLKGPASSLYGGEAMGGVVNIITRKSTGPLTGMAEIGFGSFQANSQQTAMGGASSNGFDFDLSARRFAQVGDYEMGNGETRAHTGYETRNSALRLGKALAKTWRLDASGDLYQGLDIETPGDLADGDKKSGHKDIDRYGLDLRLGGNLGADNRIDLTAFKTNETTENHKHYTGWSVPVQVAPHRDHEADTDWLGFQLKDEYAWKRHRFIAGIDYQDINSKKRGYNQDGTRKAPSSPDEGRENWGGYLETVWKLLDERLTATLGGRHDTFTVETKTTPYKTDFTPNSEDFSTFSPRAGLNYLFKQGVRFHTTIGKAFVPPTAAQLAGYSEEAVGGVTMVIQGNPDLDPESSTTFDFGAGYDRSDWGLSCDLTCFHTDVRDKIISVTSTTTTTYENSLSAEMAGLETELSLDIGAPLHWHRSLVFFVNSTHMLTAEEEESPAIMRDIHNVAKHTVNYGLQYAGGAFDARLQCRRQGRMKDTDWNTAGYPEVEYPSFTVADLVIGFSFPSNHRLTVKADNLFNEEYYEKKGFPKPGRAFFASYRYEF